MTSDPIVTIAHIRAAKLCTAGARFWFKHHNLAWSQFLSNGIPASQLEATNDPLAARAVAIARKESSDGK